jgi:hypothetical protein
MTLGIKSIWAAECYLNTMDLVQLKVTEQLPVTLSEEGKQDYLGLLVGRLDKEWAEMIRFGAECELLEMSTISGYQLLDAPTLARVID